MTALPLIWSIERLATESSRWPLPPEMSMLPRSPAWRGSVGGQACSVPAGLKWPPAVEKGLASAAAG
jgi:hypothetical protein